LQPPQATADGIVVALAAGVSEVKQRHRRHRMLWTLYTG